MIGKERKTNSDNRFLLELKLYKQGLENVSNLENYSY